MRVKAAFASFVVAACVAGLSAGQEHKHSANAAGKNPAFEQFKGLAGEWVGKEVGKKGQDIHLTYKVTAGGSAVVETIFPGTDHEMVTLIHPDGNDLLLTHYCMLGNQPQMRASGKENHGKVDFKFVRATNLKSDKDMHMHNVTYTFVDTDTLRSEWTHFKDGQDSGRVVFELKRKK
jgi:hypothetical protein